VIGAAQRATSDIENSPLRFMENIAGIASKRL